MHWADCACALARAKAGRSMAARIAIMAMTTKSSINVKPRAFFASPLIFIEQSSVVILRRLRARDLNDEEARTHADGIGHAECTRGAEGACCIGRPVSQ